jgi:hypothetical protein
MDEDAPEADLDRIFDQLKAILCRYSPPHVERPGGTPNKRNYHLWSEGDVEIAGRKRKEVYFAGLIIQKGYVGLYYMPVYTDPEVAELLDPKFLGTLRGKSCFRIRRLDDELMVHAEEALKAGFELYRAHGWV